MNEHLVGKHRIKTTVGFEGARIGVNLIISSVQSHIEGDMDVRGLLGMSEEARKGFNQVRG